MKSPSKSLAISPSRGPALKVRPPSFRALPCIHFSWASPAPLSQDIPLSLSSGLCPVGDTPRPRCRLSLQPSHLTQPSLTVREGFKPLPKSLANHSCVPLVASGKAERARDLIDSGQSPPSVKDFLYGSRAFALPGVITPSRVRHVFLHPRFRRPLERGSMSGVIKRRKSPMRKGVQRTDYAKRWSMKGLDKAQRFS